jgi:hypothetical protein
MFDKVNSSAAGMKSYFCRHYGVDNEDVNSVGLIIGQLNVVVGLFLFHDGNDPWISELEFSKKERTTCFTLVNKAFEILQGITDISFVSLYLHSYSCFKTEVISEKYC